MFSTSYYESIYGIAVDAKSNSYVGGTTSGAFPGLEDSIIAKFDSNGNQMWIKQFGTIGTNEIHGICLHALYDKICI